MISLLRAALLSALLAPAQLGWADVLTFPDPNLEAALRTEANLNKPEGDITTEDMLTLQAFHGEQAEVTDTTGLEAAINLVDVRLSSNPITNYSGLSGLTNLKKLRMNSAAIADLTFLAPLTQLEELDIYSNAIEDISPLGGLTNLTSLQLDWNPVTNHVVLEGLTNLVTLSVAGNGVTNISFITPLHKLESLGLYVNQVKDISLLAGNTTLLTLGLGWNGVTNAAVLATIPNLEMLWLNGNDLTNVNFLASMTNLQKLSLDYTKLEDMSPLTNLVSLVELNVGENNLASLPDLSSLTNLEVFMVAGNHVSDLSPVAQLSALRNLHVQRNSFEDITPLTNCFQLNNLLLSGNSITNIALLGALTNLFSLEVASFSIDRLDWATPLMELRSIDLSHNFVTDLSPLTNLPNLNSVKCQSNRLEDVSPLLDMPGLFWADLTYNFLPTNELSQTWNIITELQARYCQVEFEPQLLLPQVPLILKQPLDLSASVGGTAVFEVLVEDTAEPLSFQWQKDGADLANGDRISGADTARLEIANLDSADSGAYCLRISREWVCTNSLAAQLLIVTNVAFADAGLEQAVRDALNIPSEPLVPADLAALIDLNASARGITNLSGLEAAINLQTLDLAGNQSIYNFAPLKFLNNLSFLVVHDTGLDDLKRISSLRRLMSLHAEWNFIEDLSPLASMPALTSLNLNNNELTTIDSLLTLPNLTGDVALTWNRLDTNVTAAAFAVVTNLQARGANVFFDPQYPAPVHPVIEIQPFNVAALPGDNVSFSVLASGHAGQLQYRWLKNGMKMVDGDSVGGTEGDTLWIDNVQPENAGHYRVRIWDDYGLTNSATVSLRVVTNVAFLDPNLERAVRDRLEIPDLPLTPADMEALNWVDAGGYGITNLSGIDAAVRLEWISLAYNPEITDFWPLTTLPLLNYVDLNECYQNDVTFVGFLPQLSELHLAWWNPQDLSPLMVQRQLLKLNLSYATAATNLEEVVSLMTTLDSLWLTGISHSNLSFVSTLTNLTGLNFEWNELEDLTPLAPLTNLIWLQLAGNLITNLSPLAACTNLQDINVGQNEIPDLHVLTNMPWLRHLAVDDNPISDLSPLIGKTNLATLIINVTLVTNIAPVSGLTTLNILHAGKLGLGDASFLEPLTNLVHLGLWENNLQTVPVYPHLNKLSLLELAGNPLTDISFLAGMTNLETLNLNDTGTRDLSPLAGKTTLKNLSLADNGLDDISSLATLSNLTWLTLWNNQLREISGLPSLSKLGYLDLRFNLLNCFASNATLDAIETMQNHGTTVDYIPQQPGAVFIVPNGPPLGDQFLFSIQSAPETVLEVFSSANLKDWQSIGWITNSTGSANFSAPASAPGPQFFRARLRE